MKSLIKRSVLSTLLIVAITTQASAQTRKNNETKTTVSVKKSTPKISKIPSTKVTYKKKSKKVVSVRNVPNKTVVKYSGQNFYYANNNYYTYSSGRYIAIAPKVGFKINVLPANYIRIQFNNHNYYNANGMFYTQINNQYQVVDPEIGTVVYELPSDYEKVTYNGESYYEYANILYEKVQVNGTRAYEVVGIIDMP